MFILLPLFQEGPEAVKQTMKVLQEKKSKRSKKRRDCQKRALARKKEAGKEVNNQQTNNTPNKGDAAAPKTAEIRKNIIKVITPDDDNTVSMHWPVFEEEEEKATVPQPCFDYSLTKAIYAKFAEIFSKNNI